MRFRDGVLQKHGRNLTTQKVGSGWAIALVGDMRHVDTSTGFEQLQSQVCTRSDATRGEVDFAGSGLGQGQKLRHVFSGDRGVGDQNHGRPSCSDHRAEVLASVIAEPGRHQAFIDRQIGCDQQQGVAIGRRARDQGTANGAAATAFVVHDHGLPESGLKLGGEQAAQNVREPAGRVRHHQADGFVRVGGLAENTCAGSQCQRSNNGTS